MGDIIRRFCAYGMEYKEHEGYTHDWVTLLPEVPLDHNTSQNFTTGKLPSLVEKGWNPLLPGLICRNSHYHQADRENAVEVRLTDVFSRKHPVFQVSLVKPYFQTGEDKFLSRNKTHTPQDIVEVEDSHGPVKRIIKARKIRLNGKHQRQYLARFKNQKADKDKWLTEDSIPDGDLHLRRFRASRRAEKCHQ
ncbi:hypothetical protein O181_015609 [Austropuccinia psidii MF-1]|uniref:Uncharacterized protein n=1 Tax=Austropuccinia psidii MF-1 TaxID=1389203 RepID=A0A9Q3C2B5_9BASI|nr:hypothetical protein [Austropuccinia psidii MF-1]